MMSGELANRRAIVDGVPKKPHCSSAAGHDMSKSAMRKRCGSGPVPFASARSASPSVRQLACEARRHICHSTVPPFAEVEQALALGKERQMVGHFNRALDNGLTVDEIKEIITHLAFYSGWPTAMTAAAIFKDVVEKREAS